MQSASVLIICFYGDLMKGMELVGKLWRCFFNDNKVPIEPFAKCSSWNDATVVLLESNLPTGQAGLLNAHFAQYP